jgi:hypothetical protein
MKTDEELRAAPVELFCGKCQRKRPVKIATAASGTGVKEARCTFCNTVVDRYGGETHGKPHKKQPG